MLQPYRVFLATPKDMDPFVSDGLKALVHERFKKALGHDGVEVVKAEDDFRENIGRCGGWDSWADDVGRGVDYLYRTPRFNAIVCTQQAVGKATSLVVRAGLDASRMVAVVMPDKSIQRVVRLDELDPTDFKGGWFLVIDN